MRGEGLTWRRLRSIMAISKEVTTTGYMLRDPWGLRIFFSRATLSGLDPWYSCTDTCQHREKAPRLEQANGIKVFLE